MFCANPTAGILIFGAPALVESAQTQNLYNVIDNSGMLPAIRQGITIEFFKTDSTNIRQNKISVRIESRLAFPVYGQR